MPIQILADNAYCKLAASIADSNAWEFEFKDASDRMLSALGQVEDAGYELYLTITDAEETKIEIVLVYDADVGFSTFTAARGQGWTTAQEWSVDDIVEARVSSLLLKNLFSGESPNGSIAIPAEEAEASGDSSIAIGLVGTEVSATSAEGVAIGEHAKVDGERSVAIGSAAQAQADSSVSIGAYAQTPSGSEAEGLISIGLHSGAEDDHCVAIGVYATARYPSSVAIGHYAMAASDGSIAIGDQATCPSYHIRPARHSIMMGYYATARGDFSMAIGSGAYISDDIKGVIQIAAIGMIRSTSAGFSIGVDGDIDSRQRAAPMMSLATLIIDLTNSNDFHEIEIPTGTHFFPEKIDVIITSASSPEGAPAIQAGTGVVDAFGLDLGGADGGTYELGKTGEMQTLNHDDDAATIQAALETVYGSGNATVVAGSDFSITFTFTVEDSELVADFTGLSGDTSPELAQTQTYSASTVNNILSASAVTVDSAYQRESFTPEPHGVDNIRVSVETAGSGTLTCRVIVTGYLIEDE